jgi:pilus assembly protein Flp/PilA
MLRMIRNLQAKTRSEQGASAVEYGLLVSLIAAVIVVAVLLLGGVVKGAFQDTKSGVCKGSAGSPSTAAACAKTS